MPQTRLIPLRSRRGVVKHALPETVVERTMCGRPVTGLIIDEGIPTCKTCCRAIAAAIALMGE